MVEKEYEVDIDAVYSGDNPDQYEWYMTPLMEAAYYKRADVCKLLLKHGTEVNKTCGHNERTALDYVGLKSFNWKEKRIVKSYGGLKTLLNQLITLIQLNALYSPQVC